MKTLDLMKLVNALTEAKVKKLLPALINEKIKNELSILIEEEIQNQVSKILAEARAPQTKHINTKLEDDMQDIIPDMSELLRENTAPPKKIVPRSSKLFSKNTALNDILNRTAVEMTTNPADEKELIRRKLEEQIRKQEMTENPSLYESEMLQENDDKTLMFDSRNISSIAAFASGNRASAAVGKSSLNNEEIKREVLKKELEMEAVAAGKEPKFDVVGLMSRNYRNILKKSKERDGTHF